MKTNRSARRIVRVRSIMICLALVGMVGGAFWSGQSLAMRVGQTAAPQTESAPAPNWGLSDLIAAAS